MLRKVAFKGWAGQGGHDIWALRLEHEGEERRGEERQHSSLPRLGEGESNRTRVRFYKEINADENSPTGTLS